MARYIVDGKFDRTNLTGINNNFDELYGGHEALKKKIEESAKSAYQLWLDQGNGGSVQDFLNSLKPSLDGYMKTADFNFIQPGKNIFNPNGLEVGRIGTNGAVYVTDTHRTTVYTEIEPSTTYIANKTMYTGQYDANYAFVKYLYIAANTPFTTEANAKFMRFGVGTGDVNILQIEKGSKTTPYEPYKKTLKGLSVDEIDKAKVAASGTTYTDLSTRLNDMDRKISEANPSLITATDDQAEQVFIAEMNKKALNIGMSRATWKNSSGLSAAGQTTTAKDLALLLRSAFNTPQILNIWGKKSYTVEVKGSNARTIPITTSVTDVNFEKDYEVLGGKTGTLGSLLNLLVFAKHKATGKLIAGTIVKADTDRWVALKQMFDAVINGTVVTASVAADGGCAFLVPENANLRQHESFAPNFDKPNSALQSPASVTKLLTCIVAIETGISLETTFNYKASDVVEGTPVMAETDVVTLRDAMYFAMLASHNTSAKAIGRVVGHYIIKTRGYV